MMNKMFNNSKIMDRFFRRVDGVVWDLMSGKVGIKNADGIITVEGEGDDAQVTINLFDQFGIEVPAFAQNTPVEAVAVGDLIYGLKGPLGWVVEKKEKSFRLLKEDGTKTTWSPPKVSTFGFDSGVMVLRSLVNVLPGGSSGLGQMQSMMMPMLMMGEESDIDLGSIMPMLMFSQMSQPVVPGADPATAVIAQNQMAQMMQMMMMSQLLGGKKGSGNFFDKK